MAAKTTLNEKNLCALGAERLASLVMELATGNAALKRQARAALLEDAGGEALAAEVRKRIATIKRSTSFVDWHKQHALVKDLDQQRRMITEKIAPSDPATALELMWRFMDLAESIYNRADDSNGSIGDVFWNGCVALGQLADAANPDPSTLADQVFNALFEGNDYAEYDGLIDHMTQALGKTGLARLKERALAAQDELAANPPKPKSGRKIGWSSSGAIYEDDFQHSSRTRTVKYLLQTVADAQGDVDAFIAEIDPEVRAVPNIAAEIAVRLLDAGRADDAMQALDSVEFSSDASQYRAKEWTNARIAVLDALKRTDEAQAQRWQYFEQTLSAEHLRAHLKCLPDFEDVEAEERALEIARSHSNIHSALAFLIAWPDLRRAADLVLAKRGDWDGNLWHLLPDIAQALAGKYPLAATVLLRALILDTLIGAKLKRYKHAARHLTECASLAHVIEDYDDLPSHEEFTASLKRDHPRKNAFWTLL